MKLQENNLFSNTHNNNMKNMKNPSLDILLYVMNQQQQQQQQQNNKSLDNNKENHETRHQQQHHQSPPVFPTTPLATPAVSPLITPQKSTASVSDILGKNSFLMNKSSSGLNLADILNKNNNNNNNRLQTFDISKVLRGDSSNDQKQQQQQQQQQNYFGLPGLNSNVTVETNLETNQGSTAFANSLVSNASLPSISPSKMTAATTKTKRKRKFVPSPSSATASSFNSNNKKAKVMRLEDAIEKENAKQQDVESNHHEPITRINYSKEKLGFRYGPQVRKLRNQAYSEEHGKFCVNIAMCLVSQLEEQYGKPFRDIVLESESWDTLPETSKLKFVGSLKKNGRFFFRPSTLNWKFGAMDCPFKAVLACDIFHRLFHFKGDIQLKALSKYLPPVDPAVQFIL